MINIFHFPKCHQMTSVTFSLLNCADTTCKFSCSERWVIVYPTQQETTVDITNIFHKSKMYFSRLAQSNISLG